MDEELKEKMNDEFEEVNDIMKGIIYIYNFINLIKSCDGNE